MLFFLLGILLILGANFWLAVLIWGGLVNQSREIRALRDDVRRLSGRHDIDITDPES